MRQTLATNEVAPGTEPHWKHADRFSAPVVLSPVVSVTEKKTMLATTPEPVCQPTRRVTSHAGGRGPVDLGEDAADLAVITAMKDDHDSGAEPVPWEQVKTDLGLRLTPTARST
jgi:hypothetical protein